VTGGLCIVVRNNAYWVGIAEITSAVHGACRDQFTIGVDCGKIINPRQLEPLHEERRRHGLSEALKEESL